MTNVTETGNEGKRNIICVVKGGVVAFIITSIAIFIFSILLTSTKISEKVIPVVIMIITGISILIGSSLSTITIKKNGFLYGALVGIFYILILYILSSILGSGFSLNQEAIIMMIIAVLTGIIGGIVGVNIKNK